jgi:hypothetical protein
MIVLVVINEMLGFQRPTHLTAMSDRAIGSRKIAILDERINTRVLHGTDYTLGATRA